MPVTINPGTSGVGTPGSVSGISDGDKGDVVVSGGGAVFTLDPTTDAAMKSRANHTGTQTASTISDFAEALDDRVNALIVAGTNITKTYDDVANTLTISSTGGGTSTINTTINYLNSDVTPITYGAGGEIATYTMNGRTWTVAYNGNGTINTETSGSFVKTYVYGDVANPTKPTSITGNGVNIDSPTYGTLLPPDAFGVTVYDTTTPNEVGIQAWIDYLESLAVNTGVKIRAKFPYGKRFAISSGLNIDCGKVHIDWNGARCYVLSSVTGVAFTLTSTNGDEQSKGTQIMSGMSDIWIRGTSNTLGTGIALVNGGIGPAHVTLERVIVGNFNIALDLTSSNVYLNRFIECNFSGSSWGVWNAAATNNGEKQVFERCVLGGNILALYLYEEAADITFFGCSFDFNTKIYDGANGVNHFLDCHFEQNGMPAPLFTQAGGFFSHLKFTKCMFWFGGTTPYVAQHMITCASGTNATVHGEGCTFFNSLTASGELASGPVYFINSTSMDNTNNNYVVSVETCLIRPSFETGIPSGYTLGGTNADRLLNTGGSLSRSTTKVFSGTQSLKWTKTSGVGATDANWVIYIPLAHGMKSITWRMWHAKADAAANSESWFITAQLVSGWVDNTGRLVVADSLSTGTTPGIVSTPTWQLIQSSDFTNVDRSVANWATHWRLFTNSTSLSAQDIYLSPIQISSW